MKASQIRQEAESLSLWLEQRGIEYQDAIAVFALVLQAHLKTHPLFPKQKRTIMEVVAKILDAEYSS
jgi:hypothetical protein